MATGHREEDGTERPLSLLLVFPDFLPLVLFLEHMSEGIKGWGMTA